MFHTFVIIIYCPTTPTEMKQFVLWPQRWYFPSDIFLACKIFFSSIWTFIFWCSSYRSSSVWDYYDVIWKLNKLLNPLFEGLRRNENIFLLFHVGNIKWLLEHQFLGFITVKPHTNMPLFVRLPLGATNSLASLNMMEML